MSEKRPEFSAADGLALNGNAVFVNEQAGSESNVCPLFMQPVSGWKAVFKKK